LHIHKQDTDMSIRSQGSQLPTTRPCA
jgi:hypothetical protein